MPLMGLNTLEVLPPNHRIPASQALPVDDSYLNTGEPLSPDREIAEKMYWQRMILLVDGYPYESRHVFKIVPPVQPDACPTLLSAVPYTNEPLESSPTTNQGSVVRVLEPLPFGSLPVYSKVVRATV